MGKLVFVTGGSRSGKSRFAVERAKADGGKVLFVATMVPRDDEMKSRVARHRADRPADWDTVERETGVAWALMESRDKGYKAAVVDCLTLLVSNILLAGGDEETALQEARELLEAAKRVPFTVYVVTNEVGSGVVPTSDLGRRFRDVAGTVNQEVARGADEAYLMASGLPVALKAPPRPSGPRIGGGR